MTESEKRICKRCLVEKIITEFSFSNLPVNKSTGIRLSTCKTCCSTPYPEKLVITTISETTSNYKPSIGNGAYRAAKRAYAEFYKEKQALCKTCKKSKHPKELQFDHLPGYIKIDDISLMVNDANTSIEALEAEIKKCQILCGPCHLKVGKIRAKEQQITKARRELDELYGSL